MCKSTLLTCGFVNPNPKYLYSYELGHDEIMCQICHELKPAQITFFLGMGPLVRVG